jgi:hypothetical protein
MNTSRSLCIRKATYNSKCRSVALWPAGITEIVNVARTVWKVEEPCREGSCAVYRAKSYSVFGLRLRLRFISVNRTGCPTVCHKNIIFYILPSAVFTYALMMAL